MKWIDVLKMICILQKKWNKNNLWLTFIDKNWIQTMVFVALKNLMRKHVGNDVDSEELLIFSVF